MSEFKNRIITISGEPASGKSTVIKKLKEDYEKQGYKVKIFSIGDMLREMALERGMTIEQFNKFLAANPNINIDKQIDSIVAKKGKQINSKERRKEIFIFDSRLAFHNIPDSFSIRLTTDDNVAGKRVFEDKSRGEEDRYTTIEEAIQATKARKENENKRYMDLYGVDLQNPDNYDLVIDTSFSRIEDISELIEECLEFKLQDKPYAKMWTSPKKLLAMQDELETFGISCSGNTLEDIINSIKENGYDKTSEIEVINVDGRMYIIEGHHRNFASAKLGKTLVPYDVLAKDDEMIPYYGSLARQRVQYMRIHELRAHEMFFDEKDENGGIIRYFSYNDVYPGIYTELEKMQRDER